MLETTRSAKLVFISPAPEFRIPKVLFIPNPPFQFPVAEILDLKIGGASEIEKIEMVVKSNSGFQTWGASEIETVMKSNYWFQTWGASEIETGMDFKLGVLVK